MARVKVIATFTGSGPVGVTWSGTSAQYIAQLSVQPAAGYGSVAAWLTGRQSAAATVNVSDSTWKGKVVLTLVDSPAATVWPITQTLFAARAGVGTIPTTSGAAPEAGGRIYGQPQYLPSDVSTFNVRIANRDYNAAVGAITFNVGVYASDGTGLPTGTALGVYNGVSVSGDGSVVSVGPFTGARGGDGKVVVCYGVPQSVSFAYSTGVQHGSYLTGSANVSTAPAFVAANPGSILFASLDYSTSRRRVVGLGDSIMVGYNSAYETAAWQLVASDKDWSVDVKGIVGVGSIASFAAYASNPFFYDGQQWSGSPDVVADVGTNDLVSPSLSTMQANLATLIAHIQSLTSGKIYASTVPPQTAYSDPGGVRALYNTWLRANYASLGLTAICDRAASQATGGIADNSTQTTLYAGYDSGDGTHPNAAGQSRLRTAWEAIL